MCQRGAEVMQESEYPRTGVHVSPLPPGGRAAGAEVYTLPYGLLLALADGQSGDEEVRRATSQTAVGAIKRVMHNTRLNVDDARRVEDTIRQALLSANSELLKARRDGEITDRPECSAVVVLASRQRAYVGHVGDARLYLVRKERATRMTRDHTTAQSWIDHGIMTEAEARERPEAHSLSRALGEKVRVVPEVRPLPIMLERGDVLVLTSSGVHWHLEDDEVAGMAARLEPEHACQELCAVAGSRARNPRGMALVYQSWPPGQGHPRIVARKRIEEERRSWSKIIGAVAVVLALILTVAYALSKVGGTPEEEPPVSGDPVATGALSALDQSAQSNPPSLVFPDTIDSREAPDVRPESETADVAPVPGDHVAADVVAPIADVDVEAESGRPHILAGSSVIEGEAPPVRPAADVSAGADDSAAVAVAAKGTGTTVPSDGPPEPMKLRVLRGPIKLRYCRPEQFEGADAEAAREIASHLVKGVGYLDAVNKDAGRAASHYRKARKLLRRGSSTLRRRCRRPVGDLRTRMKQRYLHIAVAAVNRAIREPENMEGNCAKARRMSQDAASYGATEKEITAVLRICK